MSRNPYEAYPAERARNDAGFDAPPPRVSIMAVLSLFCSILCCVPGLGLVAALLGIGSLVAIGASNGRVVGRPLAGIGLLLGLIATVLQGAIAVGVVGAYRFYMDEITPIAADLVGAATAGDVAGVRGMLAPAASSDLTDEEILAFGAAVRAAYGETVGPETDFDSLIETIAEVYAGRQMQPGQMPALPVAVRFDRGVRVVHIVPNENAMAHDQIVPDDLYIVLDSHTALTLRRDGPAHDSALGLGYKPVSALELPPPQDAPQPPEPEEAPEAPDAPQG